MKKILIPILMFGVLDSLSPIRAQNPAPGSSYAAVQQVQLSPQQLEELVAPIALYPDPLIALILPAATVPTDVVLAARYLRDGKDVNQVDAQNWEPSVKSLTRYPDVLNMMDENLDWTNQLGTAVIAQQGDVMQAIQSQRARANALGNLATTPQQQVIVEQQIIQIVPADPEIIYVPAYNPEVVYIERAPAYTPFVTFGFGFAMGFWLTNDCDWNHRGFYVNNYGRNGWHGYPRSNNVNININQNNYWRPNSHRPPPRPPYVPNRVNASNQQNMPAFRRPPQGGLNGNNNRIQSNNGSRPSAVAPGVANTQVPPSRPNFPSPANPGPNTPRANSSGNVRPQATSNPSQPGVAINPGPVQNARPNSAGNDGRSPREDGGKNHSQNTDFAPGRNPNQGRPGPQSVEATPQSVAKPVPLPVTPSAQPATLPKNPSLNNPAQNTRPGPVGNDGQAPGKDVGKYHSQNRYSVPGQNPNQGRPAPQSIKPNPQSVAAPGPQPVRPPAQPAATPRVQQHQNTQQPVFNSKPEQNRQVQRPPANSQNQPRPSQQRPAPSPQPQPQQSSQTKQRQSAPQSPGSNSRNQDQSSGQQQQGWQRRQ